MKKILLFVCLVLVSGCASVHYRAPKSFETYFDTPKTIAVMPPDIKVHQLTAGGVTELMDEWSYDAEKDMLTALREELSEFPGIKLVFIDEKALSQEVRDRLREEEGLYKAVAYSIINHTYNPGSIFRHKLDNFDYTLGPDVSWISSLADADALLFCSGTNYIWTTGRVCMAAFGLLVGAATGVCVIPAAGPEWLSVSLVDIKTGDFIWFDYLPMQGDLREIEINRKLADKLFVSFPKKWR